MPNNIGSTPGQIIALRALETLLEEYPLLREVSADYSDEGALFGQTVDIGIPTAFAAADNYSTTTGYDSRSVATTEATITINKHKHVTYGFNDQERSSVKVALIERYARNAAQALGKAMVTDLFGLITKANFPTESVKPATSFDRSEVVDLSKTLNSRFIPSIGRFGLIGSDHYKALANDLTLVANPGSPSNAVRSGQLDNVHGIKITECPWMPDNSQNLAGFVAIPEALCIATRVPTEPEKAGLPGTIEIVTEPKTGLSLQVRQWYDMKMGTEYRTFTLMFGVAVGQAACLERIVTQANL